MIIPRYSSLVKDKGTSNFSNGNPFSQKSKNEPAPMDINSDRSNSTGMTIEKTTTSPNGFFGKMDESPFKKDLFPSSTPLNTSLFGNTSLLGSGTNSGFPNSPMFPPSANSSSIFGNKPDTPASGSIFGSGMPNAPRTTESPTVTGIFGQQVGNPVNPATSLVNSSNPFLKKTTGFTPLFSGTTGNAPGNTSGQPGMFGQNQ